MAGEIVGKDPPDFDIMLLDGSTKKLSDYTKEGKPVVLDFYANF